MAHTSRGIWYPSTGDSVRPASRDFRDLAMTANAAIDQAVDEASPFLGTIPDYADLNDYTDTGYALRSLGSNAQTVENRPPGSPSQPFRVEVYNVSSTITHQTFSVGLGGNFFIYVRYRLTTTWHPWHLVYDSTKEEIDPLEPIRTYRTAVTFFGDSQLAGTPVSDAAQATLGAETSVTNYGRSGDTVDQVSLRAGAKEYWVAIEGGQIPSSGAVEVTTSQPIDTGRDRAFYGSIAGVVGTLSFTASTRSWSFSRSGSGGAVDAAGLQQFVSSQDEAFNHVLVVWMGGNNSWETGEFLAPDRAEHVKSAYQAFYAWAAPEKRVLFPGMTYGLSTASGAIERRELADAVNDWLTSTYPNHYCAINDWLINHGMSATGFTDTQADIDARDAGLMPPSLLVDDVHFKPEVREAIGAYLAEQLRQRGWA